MCGSVIVAGGLFLFIMNIYNYHMLDRAKGREQNQNNLENQDRVSVLEAEMKQTSVAAMELTNPEDKEKNGAKQDPTLERAETPN